MNNPRAQRAARPRELLQPMQQRIDQRASRHARSGVNRHSRRLVYHDEVTIFEEQLDWYFFRRGLELLARQNLDFHGFPGGQPVRRLCQALIDTHVPRVHQFLDASAADLRQARCEEQV
jgi:hypothetical protein